MNALEQCTTEMLAETNAMLNSIPTQARNAYYDMAVSHAKLARSWLRKGRLELANEGAYTAKCHAQSALQMAVWV